MNQNSLMDELQEARLCGYSDSEDIFFKAFHFNPDSLAIIVLDERRYIDVNKAFVEFFGYERTEVIGHTSLEFAIWPSEAKRLQAEAIVRAEGRLVNFEIDMLLNSGDTRNCLLSAEAITVGDQPYVLFIVKDITERRKLEEALLESEDNFSTTFQASPIAITIASLADGRIRSVNESTCRMFGYSREEIIGKTTIELGIWVNPAERMVIKHKLLNEQPIIEMERSFYRKDGALRVALFNGERIDINHEPYQLGIFSDITERKQAEEEIKYLHYHDKLTGLYNRAYFEDELNRLEEQEVLPVSIIMADVNGLKLINDTLGPKEGDRLLAIVAELLREYTEPDVLIARWGGDEFIILLPALSPADALTVFERLTRNSRYINVLPIQASLSFGLAGKETAAQTLMAVIQEAEENMYRNKLLESGSNRSLFLKSLQETLWTRSCETEEHCQRMQDMAKLMGKALNLSDNELNNLMLLAALHDIGKIAIPNSILDKSLQLTSDEWDLIKKHPEIGYRIARSSIEMVPIAEAILHHHERWDGSGYPLGVKGERIPLIARTIAILDTYDVMINGRPYKSAVSPHEAWLEIERCAGTQFDPQLVPVVKNALLIN